jgi:hypothetical protein
MDNTNQQGPLFNPDGFGLTAEEQRAQFIRKTYTHVALAVGLFIVIETLLLRIPAVVEFTLSLTQGWKWLVVLGLFMLGPIMRTNWRVLVIVRRPNMRG